jgi:hypothetical protein
VVNIDQPLGGGQSRLEEDEKVYLSGTATDEEVSRLYPGLRLKSQFGCVVRELLACAPNRVKSFFN